MRTDPAIQTRRGFSLVELLMAIMILGIGLISVAALFPAGILQQQRAKDDVDGPTVAKAAMDVIRSRLSQSDFGAWTDFYTDEQVDSLFGGSLDLENPAYYLRESDWPWQHPAVVVPTGPDDPLRGSVDVFNRLGYSGIQQTVTDLDLDSDYYRFFQSRAYDGNGGLVSLGIPYRFEGKWPAFYNEDDIDRLEPPSIIFSQDDRRWPPADGTGRPAQYYWDFMLRRSGGEVYVAVFVYRVRNAGGGNSEWANVPEAMVPVMEVLDASDYWSPGQGDGLGGDGVTVVPLPGTTDDFSPTAANQSWQYPGQYITDNLGMLHRVSRGRTRPNHEFDDGKGVLLDSEIPPVRLSANMRFFQQGSTAYVTPQTFSQLVPTNTIDAYFETPGLLAGGFVGESQDSVLPGIDIPLIDRLWFVPRVVTVNGQQWELVPAYAMVERL
ncbi:MAG: prepilin-type N-terminal cleavage/methylation domain-containing protein [Phycisphaerales bacterium]|nr:prepilin-type N-terminal cleavage/methylation domain-containing protein [Phycisphaerales bacterium]